MFSNFYQNNFFYKNDTLFCDDVNLLDFSNKNKTPFYIYSERNIMNNLLILRSKIKLENKLICYAIKACHNTNIIKLLKDLDCGVDCVSGGEVYRGIYSGIDPKKIVYSGCGKTDEDLEYAIKEEILQINVESINEVRKINKIAKSLNKIQKIAIRIKPNIETETHNFISTGHRDSKFGICTSLIDERLFSEIKSLEGIDLSGFSVHIGSQLSNIEEFQSAYRILIELTNKAIDFGFKIETIDFGGGFCVKYKLEDIDFDLEKYNEMLNCQIENLKNKDLKYIFEPGRYLIANSCAIIARVTTIKEEGDRKFAILDAGMNNLIRVAMYEAHHDILPILKREESDFYNFCGSVCESSDFFAKNRKAAKINEGDFIAIMSSGAYGSSMGSIYNSKSFPAEFLIKNSSEIKQIRKEVKMKEFINYTEEF